MAGNKPQNNQWLPSLLVAICIFIFSAYGYRSCKRAAHNNDTAFRRSNSSAITNSALNNSNSTACVLSQDSIGLPEIHKGDHIISHYAYTLSFDDKEHIAYWVAYTLTADHLQHPVASRTEDFRPDNDLQNSSKLEDYRRSGYDRGHLAPAYDMRWSAQAMSESFLLSNITPQDHGFNEHIWADLENAVRIWARQHAVVYVVTGPVLTDNMESIGPDKVAVPEYFYKAVLSTDNGSSAAIGFIIPNHNLHETFWKYAVPLDSIEHVTGLKLFAKLPQSTRQSIEHSLNIQDWRTRRAFVQ
jgi:endonuclease G